MRGSSFAIRASAIESPTTTATEMAMQRSPAAPYAAPIRAPAVRSKSLRVAIRT
jgi:hypothetical protein